MSARSGRWAARARAAPSAASTAARLAVRTGDVFGRSSTTDVLAGQLDDPLDGILDKFLDSNDTSGIRWQVDIGSMFTRLIFVLTDATDVGATMRISATGADGRIS
jgi:hypothetical protein